MSILLLWSLPRLGRPKLNLTTCLDQSGGLRSGAKVRMEGVDVGMVRSVQDQSANKTCPVNVQLELRLPKDQYVPRDARAHLSAEGILGPPFIEIITTGMSGPAIENGGVLQASPIAEVNPAGVDKLTDVFKGAFASLQGPCAAPDNRCVIHLESLDYPLLARQAQISGIVRVRAVLDKDGGVSSASAEGPKILKEASAENFTQWRFSPGNSRQIEITYDFRLEEPKVSYEPKPKVVFDLPDRVMITSHAPVPNIEGVTIRARKASH